MSKADCRRAEQSFSCCREEEQKCLEFCSKFRERALQPSGHIESRPAIAIKGSLSLCVFKSTNPVFEQSLCRCRGGQRDRQQGPCFRVPKTVSVIIGELR